MKVDLDPIRRLSRRLGSPETRFRAVHVAGTKGKGSTAALVAAAARACGVATGLYTSPHVEHWNERILLGGVPVAPDLFAAGLERTLDVADEHATWFDCLTAAAFWVFAHEGVELAVVEAGLGGRLDSTNALPAGVAAVTNIDLEHTEVLGSTREAIAFEKASIAKPGGVLVSGIGPADDPAQVVAERVARDNGARFVDAWAGSRATLDVRNLTLARAILGECAQHDPRLEPSALDDPALRAAARLPARFERFVYRGVPVVLDGAHVASSVRAVLDEAGLDGTLVGSPTVLFGARPDKAIEALLGEFVGRSRVVIAPRWDVRTAAPEEIAARAADLGLNAIATDDAARALGLAASLAGAGWILVTGSLHFAGALRPLLRERADRP